MFNSRIFTTYKTPKTQMKTTATFRIEQKDLMPIIGEYLKNHFNVHVKKLQYEKFFDIIAIAEDEEGGAKEIGAVEKEEKVERQTNEGFKRNWTGFYQAVREIIDYQSSKKKNFISYEDLYEELQSVPDERGKPRFVRNGVPIEMKRFKQYLSPSQISRQANMKGVKIDRNREGLTF